MIGHISAERCGALPLGSVAAVAIGGRHGGTGVAKIAGHGGVRSGQREAGSVMIENRTEPGSRRVARCASGWVSGSDVIRYGPAEGRGALPSSSVATVAIGGKRAAVVAIHVARRASDRRVRAGQWKRRRAVIER